MKEVQRLLTTGDVARHCGVSRMGVVRWIQQGKLHAYTTPGGHYRVPRADFLAFLHAYQIPLDDGEDADAAPPSASHRVLVLSENTVTLGQVVRALSGIGEPVAVEVALDGAAAATRAGRERPDLLILDMAAPEELYAPELASWLEGHDGRRPTPVLAVGEPRPGSARAVGEHSAPMVHSSLGGEQLRSAVRRLLAVGA